MALKPRQLRQVTREMVYGWVQDWKATPQPKPTKKNYIRAQLDAIDPNLASTAVDTSMRDDYPDDDVPFIQLIFDDLSSYV